MLRIVRFASGCFSQWLLDGREWLTEQRVALKLSIGTEFTDVLGCGVGFQPVVVGTQAGSPCHLFPYRYVHEGQIGSVFVIVSSTKNTDGGNRCYSFITGLTTS